MYHALNNILKYILLSYFTFFLLYFIYYATYCYILLFILPPILLQLF